MDKNRKCEICNKDDLPTIVKYSSTGAFSMNYCGVCAALGAEQTGFQSEYNCASYNINDDRYYDSSDNHIPIKTKEGNTYDTRNEYVQSISAIKD